MDETCSFREKRELALISEEALTGRFSFGKSETQGEGAERKGAGLTLLWGEVIMDEAQGDGEPRKETYLAYVD